jgi:hypothetical protein
MGTRNRSRVPLEGGSGTLFRRVSRSEKMRRVQFLMLLVYASWNDWFSAGVTAGVDRLYTGVAGRAGVG